jgi:colanic acid biosynthesis glycosyl transferase WcaI
MPQKKRFLLLYHFMHPDQNVSAQHFSQLGQSLAELGYSIYAWPSNRTRAGGTRLDTAETISNIEYERVNRFDFNQSRGIGRIFNSFVVITVWIFRFLVYRKKFDAIILGTDPIFSYVAIPFFKLINPNIRILYWVFDLHPEGTIAEGAKIPAFILKTIKLLAKYSYASADYVIPLSECMQNKLEKNYGDLNIHNLIAPWAIEEDFVASENDIEMERQLLFGDCRIAILYSGNYGKCHDLDPLITLAECAKADGRFGFCIAGNATSDAQVLKKIKSKSLTNIKLAEMVPYEKLPARLKAADLHFVSVKSGFSGVVVPSKMFGALAMDKPVIVSADEDCSLGNLAELHKCGFYLNQSKISVSAQQMLDRLLIDLSEVLHPEKCREVYEENYSRDVAVKRFIEML